MCLIAFAWQRHPQYRFVLAANRDEMHARPAAPMDWWPDEPDLLAGRDLQAGGTWLALSRGGRFATVTNFRERFRTEPGFTSRGKLVTDFVLGDDAPLAFLGGLDGERYAGFSLLLSDGETLAYGSNRGETPRALEPGTYGLSNATLDTPWPKLTRCRAGLDALIERNAVNPSSLMQLMADTTPAPVRELDPDLPVDLARAVSAPFIKTERYGTRCTTIVLIADDGETLVAERRFGADGRTQGEQQFRFPAGTQSETP